MDDDVIEFSRIILKEKILFHRKFQVYLSPSKNIFTVLRESFFSYYYMHCYSLKCLELLTGLVREITVSGLSVPVS